MFTFQHLTTLLTQINEIGLNVDTQGCNRPAYTAQEVGAIASVRDRIVDEAARLNLLHYITCLQDAAGNAYITTRFPNRSQYIFTGSHLDTVPEGGKFDGAVGVVLGAGALIDALRYYADGLEPRFNVCLCIWRAEESACWRKALLGSALAFGRLTTDAVHFQTTFNEVTLEEAINRHGAIAGFESNGVSADTIKAALETQQPLLPQIFVNKIAGFIEFHSAQGPIPENAQLAIINRGIRGTCRPEFSYSTSDDDRAIADLLLSKEQAVLEMEPDSAVLTF
ncbi:MAG: M20/M25/M40 family metallo-hydrolase, partial [Proteobacteria bacterium]|nr:M20/M25/M40 family metallo-hydrolase [Pseudomonadota bacterium]